jgi:hypothetical protein
VQPVASAAKPQPRRSLLFDSGGSRAAAPSEDADGEAEAEACEVLLKATIDRMFRACQATISLIGQRDFDALLRASAAAASASDSAAAALCGLARARLHVPPAEVSGAQLRAFVRALHGGAVGMTGGGRGRDEPPLGPPWDAFAYFARCGALDGREVRAFAHACSAHNHACSRAHRRMQTHEHGRTRAHSHARVRPAIHSCAQLRTYVQSCVRVRTATHACTQLRTAVRTRAQLRTAVRTRAHSQRGMLRKRRPCIFI